MEIDDIVRKLVGNIKPVGETYADSDRLENLKVLTSVVDSLMYDIDQISRMDRYEDSIQKAVNVSKGFLRHVHEEYKVAELTTEKEDA